MCEFCTKHGEGKKWYLNMRNYSDELFHQKKREQYMDHFLANLEEETALSMAQFDNLKGKPIIYGLIRRMASRKQKAEHWGQVVPIEDIEQIIDLQDSIVRLPCVCRSLTTGRREARYCFGMGTGPRNLAGKYPDYSSGLEVMSKEETKKAIRSLDKQGMVHSVWTFKAPYISGLCNCDQDCMAYRSQTKVGFPVMFRAEYVALVNWDQCTGCKKCLLNCQFGAIRYSNSMKRPTIEMAACYGCGVCRAVCDKDAITLKPRQDFAGLPW